MLLHRFQVSSRRERSRIELWWIAERYAPVSRSIRQLPMGMCSLVPCIAPRSRTRLWIRCRCGHDRWSRVGKTLRVVRVTGPQVHTVWRQDWSGEAYQVAVACVCFAHDGRPFVRRSNGIGTDDGSTVGAANRLDGSPAAADEQPTVRDDTVSREVPAATVSSARVARSGTLIWVNGSVLVAASTRFALGPPKCTPPNVADAPSVVLLGGAIALR